MATKTTGGNFHKMDPAELVGPQLSTEYNENWQAAEDLITPLSQASNQHTGQISDLQSDLATANAAIQNNTTNIGLLDSQGDFLAFCKSLGNGFHRVSTNNSTNVPAGATYTIAMVCRVDAFITITITRRVGSNRLTHNHSTDSGVTWGGWRYISDTAF